MTLAALPLMFAVGVSLGLLGGGGSILAVPVLVYAAGMPARPAVALSLVIVGLTSLASALLHARGGRVDGRAAVILGAAGMAAAPLGARLAARVEAPVLLLAFSALMLVVGALMLRGRPEGEPSRPVATPVLAAAGLAVGLLTGFLGVGGGFLIVPALVLLAGLPFERAVGTSLAIITMNSLVAAIAHRASLPDDIGPALALGAAALVGAAAGARGADRLSPALLRRGFAVLVLIVGTGMGLDNARALLRAQ